MAEGARLESVFSGNTNVGSNPTLSAISERRPSMLVIPFYTKLNSPHPNVSEVRILRRDVPSWYVLSAPPFGCGEFNLV